jgi:hypothetical protein
LVWFGLVWFGLVWFGLVWFGLVWFGLVWFGLVWPTTIRFEDYLATIQSLKSDYQHFVQVLEALKPALMSWFQATAHDPIPVMIPSTSFLEVNDKGFPAPEMGYFPDQIVDPLAFAPLQAMLYCYIRRRLTCNQVLAIGTVQERQCRLLLWSQATWSILPKFCIPLSRGKQLAGPP